MDKINIEWPKRIFGVQNFIGWIDLCNGTMYRLTAFKSDVPKQSLFIAIESRGNYYFADNGALKHPNYVSEKLSIPDADAAPLADWINSQLAGEYEDKPHYFGSYELLQNLVEYHGNIDEVVTPVLIPRILNNGPI